MVSENWVEIRVGIGGQPTLVEDRSVFAALEHLRFYPRAIAAIGGHLKREMFDNKVIRGEPTSRVQGVSISAWSKSQLLIDCELHASATLAAVNVLPPTGSRRQRSLQALIPPTRSQQALFSLSFEFY